MKKVKLSALSGKEHEFYIFHCEFNFILDQLSYYLVGTYSDHLGSHDATILVSHDPQEIWDECVRLNHLVSR